MEQLQTIFNKAIKTMLYLPQGTPTTILLAETGFTPIKYIIYKKRTMQAHRIESKKDTSLIKRITRGENSIWRSTTIRIMDELEINKAYLTASKNIIRKNTDVAIKQARKRELLEEVQHKSKVKHWYEMRGEAMPENRPQYMNKLTRKQCNAIIKTRARMLPTKTNQRSDSQDTTCRICGNQEETQVHVLKECEARQTRLSTDNQYEDIFKDSDIEKLRKIANDIIDIMKTLEEEN